MSVWRNEFDKILKSYGHNILLQRRIVDTAAGIYASRENHGFDTKLERHTVRSRLAGKSGSVPDIKMEKMEGMVQDVDQLFYFRWDAKPDKHDRIYEEEVMGTETFIIDWAQAMRGPNGQLIYWVAGANIEDRIDA